MHFKSDVIAIHNAYPSTSLTETSVDLKTWDQPQKKTISYFVIDWDLLVKNERIQISTVPDMPYQMREAI